MQNMNVEEIKRSRIKSNLYSIIPASVRYDVNITYSAKFLYAEITAALSIDGTCDANNTYFSKIMNVHESTVSKYLRQLETRKYIKREIIDGTRKIKLPSQVITFIAPPDLRDDEPQIDQELQNFLDEYLKYFEKETKSTLQRKKLYYKKLLERLSSFSQEEMWEAMYNRIHQVTTNEWFLESRNKKHAKNIYKIIEDDDTLLKCLNLKREINNDQERINRQDKNNESELVKFKVEQDEKDNLLD